MKVPKRTHIKMSAIKGRSDDMLIIRGVNLFHTQIEELLLDFQAFSPNYQLIVTREKSLDNVLLKVELEKDFEKALVETSAENIREQKELLKKNLSSKIQGNIGLRLDISIENYGQIPRSQGGKLAKVIDKR